MDFFCASSSVFTQRQQKLRIILLLWNEKKSKVKITLLYCVWDEGGKKDGRMKKCWITIRKVSLFMYVVQLYHSNFFLLLSDFVASIVTATVILHTSWRIRISRKEFSRHEIFSFYFFDRIGKSKKYIKKTFMQTIHNEVRHGLREENSSRVFTVDTIFVIFIQDSNHQDEKKRVVRKKIGKSL